MRVSEMRYLSIPTIDWQRVLPVITIHPPDARALGRPWEVVVRKWTHSSSVRYAVIASPGASVLLGEFWPTTVLSGPTTKDTGSEHRLRITVR